MKLTFFYPLAAIIVSTLAACSDESDTIAVLAPVSYDEQGPYAVGNQTISVMNASQGRMLEVEVWYPANASGAGQSILDFPVSEVERDALAALLPNVPESCTTRETHSSASPEPIGNLLDGSSKLPLVVFSHCFECTRYSAYSLAERLASHGIAVAAPGHVMNTLFDTGAMINAEFLSVRASDVSAVLDELLTINSAAVPEALQGRFDPARVGVAGHSYGAVTAGKVLQDDARFKAGLIIAAPVESPVLPGVEIANIDEPMLFMIAQEDNSIGSLGNLVLRLNFQEAASPAWKVELADAGHWSFTNIAGIVPGFRAGCGDGVRQTEPGEAFTYLANDVARGITAAYGVRFFASQLLGDEEARMALSVPTVPGVVDVETKSDGG